MSRSLFTLVGLLITGTALAGTSVPDRLRLIDLTETFAQTWEATASLPDTERAAAVRVRFASILPGFYDAQRSGSTEARYDARLLRGLKAFPEQRVGIAAVSSRFDTMFLPALRAFEVRFGAMTGYRPIYLVNSLGEFDGGTRSLPDGETLLFGADMIARLHMSHDIQPFFHHELFHIYHQRHFAGCQAVWCELWTEGLAVYVANALNPAASDEDLLLTFPEHLRPAVEKDRTAAACAVVARLESTDEAVLGALFSNGRLSPELPSRFGYYVGYLVASDMARTRTLKELAHMKVAQIRSELEASLRRLGRCPT